MFALLIAAHVFACMCLWCDVAIRTDITFELHLPQQHPPLLYGDAERVRQILINLMGNGLKVCDASTTHHSMCHFLAPYANLTRRMSHAAPLVSSSPNLVVSLSLSRTLHLQPLSPAIPSINTSSTTIVMCAPPRMTSRHRHTATHVIDMSHRHTTS